MKQHPRTKIQPIVSKTRERLERLAIIRDNNLLMNLRENK